MKQHDVIFRYSSPGGGTSWTSIDQCTLGLHSSEPGENLLSTTGLFAMCESIPSIPSRVHRGDLEPFLVDRVETADTVEVVHAVEAADQVDEHVDSGTAVVRARSWRHRRINTITTNLKT